MSSAPDDPFPLAAEFPGANGEDWRRLVSEVLKGASFEKKLVSRTDDGLRIEPLYPRLAGAQPIAGRPAGTPWQVLSRIEHPDPAIAGTEARHELENGATGLLLVLEGAVGARGYGLAPSRDAIAQVLGGIQLDGGIAIELDLGPETERIPRTLADLLRQKGVLPGSIDIRAGLGPLALMARTGGGDLRWPDPSFVPTIQELAGSGLPGPFAVADGRPVHDAGGSEAQELAFALASALAYLRALEAGGFALEVARSLIFFRLSADTDQFLTISKLRALRRLWARIEEACGLAAIPTFVSIETAWRMFTRRDPWVNMLRATVAAFAAGLGGANAVTVLPFTSALGLPDRFARRVARNTQLILMEESNLARVADPAAGAGAVEAVTEALAHAAWEKFQDIEAAGGVAAALEAGAIQKMVEHARAERENAIATRRQSLTGTSEFPHLAELPVAVLDVPPRSNGISVTRTRFASLSPRRLGESFERLRDASDRRLQETGSRPKVFLANLGPLAAFTARATYAANFFEAGGIEAVGNDGFAASGDATDFDKLVAAFRASGAAFACLCSSDDVYARQAPAGAAALALAGASRIYLAGRPGENAADLKKAGVNAFIYMGCNALTTLEEAWHDIIAPSNPSASPEG